jgi:MFS family permease
MKISWSKVVFPIASLYACRMLGLFLLIPVFTLFASHLEGATPQLIGIAFGAYGLAQACMQIPFGLLSDYFGRKPLIAFGLILLLIGSIIGAFSHSIWWMILARTLQGFGAIGSVLLALLSDLTPSSDRAKAMAVIGVTIGVSFSLAFVLSPLITQAFGLAGIFHFISVLASLGLVLLYAFIPSPQIKRSTLPGLQTFTANLRNRELQKLNFGIFVQHACLTSMFYVLPLRLKTFMLMDKLSVTWHFYLPIVMISFLVMAPILVLAEKKQYLESTLKISIVVLVISQALLGWYSFSWVGLICNVFIYFVAFNLLEALLPSQVSKNTPSELRGTAMGIYSTCQFFGIFAGAVIAGWLYPYWGDFGIFIINAMLSAIWFGVVLRSRQPQFAQ